MSRIDDGLAPDPGNRITVRGVFTLRVFIVAQAGAQRSASSGRRSHCRTVSLPGVAIAS